MGIFPTRGLDPGLLHCRRILYHLSHQESPFKEHQQREHLCNTLCVALKQKSCGFNIQITCNTRIALSLIFWLRWVSGWSEVKGCQQQVGLGLEPGSSASTITVLRSGLLLGAAEQQHHTRGKETAYLIPRFFEADAPWSSVMATKVRHPPQRHVPGPASSAHSRLLSTLPTGGAFVTLDKPTLMYHYHPESLVYIRVQSCIHVPTVNYINSTIQDSFTTLNVLLVKVQKLYEKQIWDLIFISFKHFY